MNRNRIVFLSLVFAVVLMLGLTPVTAQAAEADSQVGGGTETTETQEPVVELVKKKGYYYCYIDGEMKTGWQEVDGKTYYFKKKKSSSTPKGAALTGLRKIGDYNYYFTSTGKMKTGWKTVKGKQYYFRTKAGTSARKGAAYTGKHTIENHMYYFASTGKMKTGWFTAKGKLYYATKKGRLKHDTKYKGITFNSKGYAKSNTASKLKKKTMSIVSKITTSKMTKKEKLKACWDYITKHSRWKYAGIYPDDFKSGWQISMAYTMLTKKKGNCYGFACGFAALANEVGYDSYVVVGRVSGSRDRASDGMTRHSWVMINGRYYDPEAQYAGWYKGVYGKKSYSVKHKTEKKYKFIS